MGKSQGGGGTKVEVREREERAMRRERRGSRSGREVGREI